jgi:hypothetical protein
MHKVSKKIADLFKAVSIADFACNVAVKQEMPPYYVMQFVKIRQEWSDKAWSAAKKQFPDIVGKPAKYDGTSEIITIEEPESV